MDPRPLKIRRRIVAKSLEEWSESTFMSVPLYMRLDSRWRDPHPRRVAADFESSEPEQLTSRRDEVNAAAIGIYAACGLRAQDRRGALLHMVRTA